MSTSQRRRESNWKQRKHHQNPHGKIKSLEEYSNEIGAAPPGDAKEASKSSSTP